MSGETSTAFAVAHVARIARGLAHRVMRRTGLLALSTRVLDMLVVASPEP
jgi:hypothetical protein